MQYTTLGQGDEKVSNLCLGCMYFGTSISSKQSFKLLDDYKSKGGNFLDTANCYSFWVEGYKGGESEVVLGNWLNKRNNRNKMFVATKVGVNMPPKVPISLSSSVIIEQCEASLRRLKTDYIDLFYAHPDHRSVPLEETLEALNDLVKQGKVRFIGCNNTLAWRIAKAAAISRQNGWAEYCCVQQRHSYLRQKSGILRFSNGQVPTNPDLLDYAKQNPNFKIVAYSTLLGGVYSHRQNTIADNYQPDEYDVADKKARLKVLKKVAFEQKATPNQIVLAWIVQSRPQMVALVSSSSQKRLAESLDSDKIKLTERQIEQLNKASG